MTKRYGETDAQYKARKLREQNSTFGTSPTYDPGVVIDTSSWGSGSDSGSSSSSSDFSGGGGDFGGGGSSGDY